MYLYNTTRLLLDPSTAEKQIFSLERFKAKFRQSTWLTLHISFSITGIKRTDSREIKIASPRHCSCFLLLLSCVFVSFSQLNTRKISSISDSLEPFLTLNIITLPAYQVPFLFSLHLLPFFIYSSLFTRWIYASPRHLIKIYNSLELLDNFLSSQLLCDVLYYLHLNWKFQAESWRGSESTTKQNKT